MYKRNLLFTCLAIAAACFSTFTAQSQRVDSLLSNLETRFPQEKIHVQFDKAFYNAGETVWFKAYITADNLPGPLSKNLYADLLDDKGTILQRKMMPIILAGAASNFDLPDTIRSTRLYLRAYTSWMLNFDSSLLFVRPIQIIAAKSAAKKTPVPTTYELDFFPEGGDLVERIASRVAFKATDNQGIPIAVKGEIVNGSGKKMGAFSSLHDGMGFVELTPMPGEKYKATWKDKKGVLHETNLPAATKEGAVLSTSLFDNKLLYTIKRPDSAKAENTSFYVIGQMQQRLVYSARINMSKKTEITAPIETDSLPTGVLQVTIFNADYLPIAERIVFINHDNYYFITDVHVTEKNLAKRGRNGIQLDVGDVLLSNLSISITDAGINPVSSHEESIYSQLLLTTDLQGYVYNPAYYFSSTNDSVKTHLDLVMMTNGWRRFKWTEVLAEKWPVLKNVPENFLSVNGKILGLNKALLYQKDVTGIMKMKNGSTNFFTMKVDEKGEFKEPDLYFFDTAKLYYQLNNDKDKTLTTSSTFSFQSNFIKTPQQPLSFLSSLPSLHKADSSLLVKSSTMAALQRSQVESNRVKTLTTVEVRAKQKSLKQQMDEEYTSGFFSGGDGYTFTTEGDPFARSATSVLQYLQGKVAGLQISTSGEGGATWRGSPTSFFINEVTSNTGALASINMNDVAMIKVFRPPFFGGVGGGAGGAIAVYTKKGGGDNSQIKGLPYTNILGYSPIKEFFSPDYEKSPDPEVADYRTTLYWNPFVFFDKNSRRIVIPFYNSDNCKKMRVTIEGINEQGQLTREEKIIE
ncbi:MAG: hypothetical protein V4725_09810 [Bacteroidota bacterium]